MRAVRHSASALVTLVVLCSLLLVQVLASGAQPEAHPAPPVRSDDRSRPRGAIDWPEFRAAPRAVDEDLAMATSGGYGQMAEAEVHELAERVGPVVGGGRKLELMLERQGLDGARVRERSSSPAVTSAAPTVYGVSIYLIIAWLALLYLMFRTGSISSTSDARTYAEELRG